MKNKIISIRFIRKYSVKAFIMLLLCIILLFSLWSHIPYYAPVRAEEAETAVATFENTNVLDDLKKSTIAGNEFNLDDYPYVEGGRPSVLAFIEFGYSQQSDKQGDYGLYVYVYNPQQLAFDDTERNTVQLRFGKPKIVAGQTVSPSKYSLELLNYSTEPGYEGRFYKYRVQLPAEKKRAIHSEITRTGRIYEVSGITLSYKTVLTEYVCAQKYTYTGFALGYGSELAETDTLSCVVDGFDTYVELDVKHTEYRAKGDYYYGEQSQLNSVYFRVPNRFFESYGDITAIDCEWWEYFTKPMLVVDSNKTYADINDLYGRPFSALNDIPLYYLFLINWQYESNWFDGGRGTFTYGSNMNYKGQSFTYQYFTRPQTYNFNSPPFERFAAAFSVDHLSDDFYIPGDTVLEKLRANSEKLGGEKVNDRYSRELFEDYVQNGYELGHNSKHIKADDEMDVFWNKITCTGFWNKYVSGQVDVSTEYEQLKAIVPVDETDLSGSDDAVSKKLYINKLDVSDLKNEVALAKEQDETVVLFRYSTTKYFAAKGSYTYTTDKTKKLRDIMEVISDMEYDGKFNCYAVQQTVYLDFDVIAFTYTNNGVDTVIPVVSSPIDISGGITPPLKEASSGGNSFLDWLKDNWWWLLLVIATLVVIGLFFKPIWSILCAIGKGLKWFFIGLWKVISIPFRLIVRLVSRGK